MDILYLFPPEDNTTDGPMRRCTKCGEEKPATQDFFNRKRNGLDTICKVCKSARAKAYNSRPEVKARSSEQAKARHEEYYSRSEVQERIRARGKEYNSRPEVRARNNALKRARYHEQPQVRAQILTQNKAYRDHSEVKQRIRERKRAYYNRPEIKAHVREWGIDYRSRPEVQERQRQRQRRPDIIQRSRAYRNRPEVRERHNAWRRAHYLRRREHLLAKSKEYHQTPQARARRNVRLQTWRQSYFSSHEVRERYRTHWRNRHALQASIAGTHTSAQIQDLLKRQKQRCYYCQQPFEQRNGKYMYHVDHTFPVSRVGGTDIPANDISYLVLACPSCNTKKGGRFPWEFFEGGRLL